MIIDKKLLDQVSVQAKASSRLRMNYISSAVGRKCLCFLQHYSLLLFHNALFV